MFKSMDLDIFHKIKADKKLNSEEIIKFIKERSSSITNDVKVLEESNDKLHIKGTILGTGKFLGVDVCYHVSTEGNSAKLRIDGKQYNGPLFFVVWGCLMFLVLLFLYGLGALGAIILCIPLFLFSRLQKKLESKPKELLEKIVKEVDMEFS